MSLKDSDVKSRRQRRRNNKPIENALSTTSLLDIMVILLVFLLMNYAVNPTNIKPGERLDLTSSLADLQPSKALPLTITKDYILVDDKPVVQIKDFRIATSAKRGGDDGFLIVPLFDALDKHAKRLKSIRAKDSAFDGRLLIVADSKVPYRLLSEVIYTAGQALYKDFEIVTTRI